MSTLSALAIDLLTIAALTGLGLALVSAILGRAEPWAMASLAFPLGAGCFTWLLFLLSWAGMPLRAVTILLAYAAAAIGLAILLANRRSRNRPNADPRDSGRAPDGSRLSQLAMAGILLAFLATIGPLAVGRSHSQWDAAAGWIVKGYGIALAGDIRAGATWGAWTLAYPLNIPLLAALFRVFSGDQLPGSMMVFPAFAASLAAGLYRFWKGRGVGDCQVLAGVVLLLGNPLVLLHSSIAYANLTTATYVVLAACWMIEGLEEGSRAGVTLGSLLFGLAGWTRSEAVSYGLFILPALLVLHRLVRKQSIPLLRAWLPFVILEGSWFLFGWSAVSASHLGGAMRGVWPSLQAGEYRLFELYLIPRLLAERAIDPSIWGLLFPVAAVLALAGLGSLRNRATRFTSLAALIATAIAAAVPIGIFYVRAFTRTDDFIPFLNRSFDRAFLPAALMLLMLGFLLAFGARAGEPIVGPGVALQAPGRPHG